MKQRRSGDGGDSGGGGGGVGAEGRGGSVESGVRRGRSARRVRGSRVDDVERCRMVDACAVCHVRHVRELGVSVVARGREQKLVLGVEEHVVDREARELRRDLLHCAGLRRTDLERDAAEIDLRASRGGETLNLWMGGGVNDDEC
eukprot:6037956-Pleurochrysis_carterae.AAC.1